MPYRHSAGRRPRSAAGTQVSDFLKSLHHRRARRRNHDDRRTSVCRGRAELPEADGRAPALLRLRGRTGRIPLEHDGRSTHGAYPQFAADPSEIDLDRQGFALVEQHTAVQDFWDDEEVRRVYYPEAERFIAEVTGASRVFIFDHLQRRRVPDISTVRAGGPRQPATRVHVDHTARSGPQRVRDLLPDEAEELLKGRVQVINLWRPIRGPLQDAPLACAMRARSIPRSRALGPRLSRAGRRDLFGEI